MWDTVGSEYASFFSTNVVVVVCLFVCLFVCVAKTPESESVYTPFYV